MFDEIETFGRFMFVTSARWKTFVALSDVCLEFSSLSVWHEWHRDVISMPLRRISFNLRC